jgi:hypothetical protein
MNDWVERMNLLNAILDLDSYISKWVEPESNDQRSYLQVHLLTLNLAEASDGVTATQLP